VVAPPPSLADQALRTRNSQGRYFPKKDRVKALRRGLRKRQATLEKSLANWRERGRPASEKDEERWSLLRAEIATFEETLSRVLADEDVPLSPLTGSRTAELPDRVGGHDAKPD
jgi:hypothetical protein